MSSVGVRRRVCSVCGASLSLDRTGFASLATTVRTLALAESPGTLPMRSARGRGEMSGRSDGGLACPAKRLRVYRLEL